MKDKDKSRKVVVLRRSKYGLRADIDLLKSGLSIDKGIFYATFHTNKTESTFMAPLRTADSWPEAIRQVRTLICIMHAVMSYNEGGKKALQLPPDLEYLRFDIPRLVEVLRSYNPEFVSKN
jgi:hypothetical protein